MVAENIILNTFFKYSLYLSSLELFRVDLILVTEKIKKVVEMGPKRY